MTRSILFISFIFLFCSSAIAQSDKTFKPEFSVGANVGTTFSKINFITTTHVSVNPQHMLMQYVGGISARYISEKNVGLQMEVNLSQRGWEEYSNDTSAFGYSRTLNYLEIPIMTHIYFNTGKRGRIIFNLGPQFSFLLNEKINQADLIYNDDEKYIPEYFYYYEKIQRTFDWGICGGGGFELRTGIGNFILEGRYYFGLSDIYSNSKADYFATSSNQIINVKLSYLFNVK